MSNIYYVYILSRLDGTPFYVGYGKGNRWLDHEREAGGKKQTHKTRIILGIRREGQKVPKEKVAEGLTRDEATALEVALIAQHGRHPNGPLVNETDGGDGTRGWTDEQRAAMSVVVSSILCGNARRLGVAHTDVSRASISAGVRKAFEGKIWNRPPLTEEARRRMSDAQKGIPKTIEHRAKIASALKGRQPTKANAAITAEVRERMNAKLRERNRSQAQCDAVRTAKRGRPFTPEHREAIKVAQQARRERERAFKQEHP